MQTRAASAAPKQFKSPRKSLGEVDASGLAKVLSASSDLALVLDEAGKIHDLSTSIPLLLRENFAEWTGRNLLDALTVESRAKAEKLIKEASAGAPTKLRELNLMLRAGVMATVNCGAMQIGDKGRILMFGRDLSATAAIQQRLIAAQAETEREYSRLRQAETRFAILFESCSDAMLIVAPATLRITEINPPGVSLIGKSAKRILGRSLTDLFEPTGARAVMTMLAAIQSVGYADEARARLDDREMRVSASLFRQDSGVQILVRLEPVENAPGLLRNAADLGDLVEALPDAFVVADADYKVVKANAAFLDMAQVASLSLVRDQPLERWLGRPGIDMGALVAILKQHGFARNFHTVLRGARGRDEDVEVSALALPDSERPSVNISIRSVPRRRTASAAPGHELPQSVEQMTELVGRVPLKDMVRSATDWIERLSIEAALIVTGDNRASAADMLGFSRQSLSMKMRRYGLGDSAPDDEA